jgi:hypothetical protein
MHYGGYYEINESDKSIIKIDGLNNSQSGMTKLLEKPGFSPTRYNTQLLLAQKWSPIRLLFDGSIRQRIQNITKRRINI